MNQRITRWITPGLLAGLLLACEAEPETLEEATRTEVVGPSAGVARSADGMFELRFELGAFSEPTEVTIRTLREVAAGFAADPDQLWYEVVLSACNLAKPELVTAVHQVPDGSSWRGQLHILRLRSVTGSPSRLESSLGPEGLEARGALDCRADEPLSWKRVFGLSAARQEACTPSAPGLCEPCAVCDGADPRCQQPVGLVCAAGQCVLPVDSKPGACGEGSFTFVGWDDPPGSGRAYVLDSLVAGVGRLGSLFSLLSDPLRQRIISSDTLLGLELAGPAATTAAEPAPTTVKFYALRDADDPFFPANNFQTPQGETRCCEFKIAEGSLTEDRTQARFRAAARVREALVESLTPTRLPLSDAERAHEGDRFFPFNIDSVVASFKVEPESGRLVEGRLVGTLLVSELGKTPNPYCRSTPSLLCPRPEQSGSLLELALLFGRPDVDRDGNGIVGFDLGDDGRIARCRDGNGSFIPPLVPEEPWTCAEHPRMVDGFSVSFEFTAVRASFVGVAP